MEKPYKRPVASAGPKSLAGTRRPSADARSRGAAIVRSAGTWQGQTRPAGTRGRRAPAVRPRPARHKQGRLAVTRPPAGSPLPRWSPRSKNPRRSFLSQEGWRPGSIRKSGQREGGGPARGGPGHPPPQRHPPSQARYSRPRPQIHLHVSGSSICVPSIHCPVTFPWMSTRTSRTCLPNRTGPCGAPKSLSVSPISCFQEMGLISLHGLP